MVEVRIASRDSDHWASSRYNLRATINTHVSFTHAYLRRKRGGCQWQSLILSWATQKFVQVRKRQLRVALINKKLPWMPGPDSKTIAVFCLTLFFLPPTTRFTYDWQLFLGLSVCQLHQLSQAWIDQWTSMTAGDCIRTFLLRSIKFQFELWLWVRQKEPQSLYWA